MKNPFANPHDFHAQHRDQLRAEQARTDWVMWLSAAALVAEFAALIYGYLNQ